MKGLLINEIPSYNITEIYDEFNKYKIFENKFIENKSKLLDQNNYYIYEIDSKYDYRPDKLAYDLWNQEYLYPIILFINNIPSILHFNISEFENKIKIPTDEILKFITSEIIYQKN